MKISHRLIVQSIAAAVALVGVGALGLVGVRYIQQELHVMTSDILPLKNQLLKIEQSKEQSLGALLALSHSTSAADADQIASEVDAKLAELQRLVDAVDDKQRIGDIDISVFFRTRDEILRNIETNFRGVETYRQASASAQSALHKVSAAVAEVDKEVKAVNDATNDEAQLARDSVNLLLDEQREANRLARLLGRANVLIYATDAVQSKYRIEPAEEKHRTLVQELEQASAETVGYPDLSPSLDKIQAVLASIGDPSSGLFKLKRGLLEEGGRNRISYRKKLRELSTLVLAAEESLSTLIGSLDSDIALANAEVDKALTLSSDPSSVTAIDQSLMVTSRDMQVGLQTLLASTDLRTLNDEYEQSKRRTTALAEYAQRLTGELNKLDYSSVSQTANKIAQSVSEVEEAIDRVYAGKQALFKGNAALRASIENLKGVSQGQRENGEQLIASINNRLGAVIDSVDGQVKQSTSLIVVISLVAVAFSAIFSYITTKAIIGRLQRALQVAESVSSGDLSPVVQSKHRDEISSVLDALARMVSMLDGSVRQIRSATASVNQGAEEISSGSSTLNERNSQQASHLNDTANSTRKINELVQQGAQSVQQVSELSYTAADAATRGSSVVRDAMASMGKIENGAKEISNIIDVIDSIAFQTNILALNAAVEASRAGEAGRGFAVVASEVRALASKSKESANQIKEIIDSNVAEVEAGSLLVNNAGQHIEDVVAKVEEVKSLMEEIAVSSKQQADSISLIDSSVDEIEGMTQKNVNLSEHTSGAAANLLQQARTLDQAVSVFKL